MNNITLRLSIMEMLLIIQGLDCVIKNMDIHEVDRMGAEQLKKELSEKLIAKGIELHED